MVRRSLLFTITYTMSEQARNLVTTQVREAQAGMLDPAVT